MLGGKFGAHRFGQPDDGEFGRVVYAESRYGHLSRQRRRVDEVAALAVCHDASGEGLHAIDHAVQVDADNPVPIGIGHFLHGPRDPDAGVVADDMHPAECALRLVGGTRHRVAVGDVNAQRDHFGVARREGRRRLRQGLFFDVRDHDLHAGRGERPRHGQADAARAARDRGDLARYVPHLVTSLAKTRWYYLQMSAPWEYRRIYGLKFPRNLLRICAASHRAGRSKSD